jgi:indole-3-glycerol phosphate synthase
MNGILREILEYKREYVRSARMRLPLRELEQLVLDSEKTRNFTEALSGKCCSLIAEIKTASPSKGVIRDNIDIETVAKLYEENGASCISVLTDEKYFMGSLERLLKVRKAVKLPILRKDFIIDVYQIFEARYAGADAVLLIASCLDDTTIVEFLEVASLLNLDCLVEVHSQEEMNRIGSLPVKLIGINNRNLETFQTDISVTGRLAPYAPEQALIVSESGIVTAEDVRKVYSMGADAVLVGEAIMREKNIAQKVYELAYAIP